MLNGIGLLRGYACLSIMAFHVTEFLKANLGVRLPQGYDDPAFHLFLSISGFVLAYTTRPDERPVPFLIKRIARVAPLYWVLTATVAALATYKNFLFPFADLSPASIAASLAFLPYADLAGRIQPVLFVGWTLNYMMLFYGLFALCLLAPRRFRALTVVVAVIAVMLVAPIAAGGDAGEFYSNSMLLEFAGGSLAGAALARPSVARWARTAPLAAIAFLAIGLLVVASIVDFDGGFAEVLIFGLPATLLVFVVAARDVYQTPIQSSVARRLGDLSFAIYLVHPIVLAVVGGAMLGLTSHKGLATVLVITCTFAVTLMVAQACHSWIEKPAARLLRPKGSRPSRPIPPPQIASTAANDAQPPVKLASPLSGHG